MTVLEMTLLLLAAAVVAGFLGSLTGMGGGVVIIPLLVLVFHIDVRYAIGTSLVSVIATSSGAAAAYVREGYTNMRIGMFLEIATTIGAIVGAFLAVWIPGAGIAVIFGVVLIASAWMTARRRHEHPIVRQPGRLGALLRLHGAYPTPEGPQTYEVRRVPAAFSLMGLAGVLSGLLGIGSGALKVLAMDQAMGLPFKVSTTTSNFMIGVTAAASAGVYLHQGYIDPGLTMPVMLGVLAGSLLGARVLARTHPRVLRWVFAAVIVALGFEMIYNGLTGRV